MGLKPSARALSSFMRTRAAAPSLMPGALPAVMQPLGSNTGRSLASFSRLVSRRGASSVSTVSVPPRTGTSTGTISSAMRPPSMAASARWWLRSAHWSCSSRLTLNSRAICSPWLPMWTSPKAHHNPSWMTESSTWPWPRRRPQRASIRSPGPRLMLSMPPATTTSASPARIRASPRFTARMPDAHTLLIVSDVTVSGSPAAMLA